MAIDDVSARIIAQSRLAGSYALYRLPEERCYVYVGQSGAPVELDSLTRVGQQRGLVIAPFQPTPSEPIVLIRPDTLLVAQLPEAISTDAIPYTDGTDLQQQRYEAGFVVCKRRLREQPALRKVVYARRLNLIFTSAQPVDALQLFIKACLQHPHSYVSLWSTPATGTWLVATPETLLRQDVAQPMRWHTMALAGTMPWCGHLPPLDAWSTKNREEQAYVTAYIHRRLEGLVYDMSVHDCRSVRSASVVHLRTDIDFRLRDGVSLGAVIGRLHPTPAVCGESLMAARSAIRAAEAMSRRYYAGFSGPIGLAGYTGLYVSLRCMELKDSGASLYAGGGLLAASQLTDEWDETCRKLQPMLRLFS